MDGSHLSERAAEKEKIKQMLCDAIRILCQNTVSHHTKLAVKALIGITVDDGEDTIIVSINESIDAADTESYQTEDQYDNMETDANYYHTQETTVSDSSHFNDGTNYGQQYNPSIPYQAVVKNETSVISYNVGQYDNFPPPNSITSSQTANQYFPPNASYTVPYGHQGAVGVGRGKKVVASGPRRGRGGQGPQRAPRKTASVRSVPVVKQEHGGEVDTMMGGRRSSVDTSEISHITLYTCQRCGKQLNNQSSFLRHKKSHLGIVYRCDGCGKILSRNDHLQAHRRKCLPALQQAPLDD